jgi:hypothetical protein
MMTIDEVVDTKRYKYVVPWDFTEDTPWGPVTCRRGEISDGASGVDEVCMEAFFVHDKIYHLGRTDTQSVGKFAADIIYGIILKRSGKWCRMVVRPAGLLLFPVTSWISWYQWRKKRKAKPTLMPHVPKPEEWLFKSWRLKDAVWEEEGHHNHTSPGNRPL